MANYDSVGRTNYFAVKDKAALAALLSGSGIEIVDGDDGSSVALLDSEGAGWMLYTEDDEDVGEDRDLTDLIGDHLQPGAVAVFKAVGREKLRYLGGYSVAVNDQGAKVEVNLDDIYDAAAQAFGVDPSKIGLAEL